MSTLGDLRTNKTWRESLTDLQTELRRWGIQDYTLPTYKASRDAGSVTVPVARNGVWAYPACQRFRTPEQNIRAIVLAIENTRKMEQRGIGMVLAEIAKLLALPPGRRDPYEVIGLPKGHYSAAVVTTAYRERLKAAHPDHGGTLEALQDVINAGKALGVGNYD